MEKSRRKKNRKELKQDEVTLPRDKQPRSKTDRAVTRSRTRNNRKSQDLELPLYNNNHCNEVSGQFGEMKISPARSYTIKPIIPAKKKELISVANAMHREAFAPRVKKLFQKETNAALSAIERDVYIGWRCPEFNWDCIRLSNTSRCFCDHNLSEHETFTGKKQNLKCSKCPCQAFNFIPERPEDIGEFWLRKRPGFDSKGWRARCRCKHTHVEHCSRTRRCKIRGCSCFTFESNFLCAACDRHLEDHATFFEDSNSRRQQGLPFGQNYIPFSELPDMRNICLTGSTNNFSRYNEIAEGPFGVPSTSKQFQPSTKPR